MILVSDTSVLIDLERGDLLEAIFALPDEFAVPDVLYDREMQGEFGERMVGLGLRVEEVSEAGVATALRYRQQRVSLSVPDSFALALAKERKWLLLTGDGQLRELADGEKRGMPWRPVVAGHHGRGWNTGHSASARWTDESGGASTMPAAAP